MWRWQNAEAPEWGSARPLAALSSTCFSASASPSPSRSWAAGRTSCSASTQWRQCWPSGWRSAWPSPTSSFQFSTSRWPCLTTLTQCCISGNKAVRHGPACDLLGLSHHQRCHWVHSNGGVMLPQSLMGQGFRRWTLFQNSNPNQHHSRLATEGPSIIQT